MKTNIVGRVENTRLPNNQALLPVFEAVVNAIHATNDLAATDPLAIDVGLIRESTQTTIAESGHLNAIESVEVTDRGIGFTEANYESFQSADSRYRIQTKWIAEPNSRSRSWATVPLVAGRATYILMQEFRP